MNNVLEQQGLYSFQMAIKVKIFALGRHFRKFIILREIALTLGSEIAEIISLFTIRILHISLFWPLTILCFIVYYFQIYQLGIGSTLITLFKCSSARSSV